MTSGQARLPALSLRKTSLVPAPSPLSRLLDFHSIDSSQEDLLDKLVLARRRHRCLFGVPKGFEPTAADASEQTPGKTVAIAERSALYTDFPLRAEWNRKIVIPHPQAPAERQPSGTPGRRSSDRSRRNPHSNQVHIELEGEPDNAVDLKLIIMASAPQSNGVTRAYGKVVQIAQPSSWPLTNPATLNPQSGGKFSCCI